MASAAIASIGCSLLLGVALLVASPQSHVRPELPTNERPIVIPVEHFTEALVVVEVEGRQVTVGTVQEFRAQALANLHGKQKGFLFQSYTR